MRHLTYTSVDGRRSVTVRGRIGRDGSETPFLHMSLARPLASSMSLEPKDLDSSIWAQIIEVTNYVQRVIALDGEWGDIRLPASDSDADRHAFFCGLLDADEECILTLQEALKAVDASPLNPP